MKVDLNKILSIPPGLDKTISRIRREIHKYPELGDEEFKTTRFIEKILKKNSIVTKKISSTGIIGLLNNPKNKNVYSKVIALRADIDALPVKEETGLPFASKNIGKMHACGHDANTSIILGAAILLSKIRDKLNGTIKFIFQPNEEGSSPVGSGANKLISAGVLKKPKPSIIFGVHVNPAFPTGIVGLKHGVMFALVDKIFITLRGKGGHAAMPHNCNDIIIASAEIIQSLQTIVSRRNDATEPVVLTIATINGGTRWNVLPNEVKLSGTIRCFSDKVLKKISSEIESIISNICKTWNSKYEIQHDRLTGPLLNWDSAVSFVEEAVKDLNIVKLKIVDKPSMGGEDFSEYLKHCPGCFIYVGTANPKKSNTLNSWHNCKFDIDEPALPLASKTIAYLVYKYLSKGR